MAKARLGVLRDSSDGFYVAQRDLELRGPGELLGTRQTGLPQYRIANLQNYLFNVSGQTEAVRSVAEAALRYVIGSHTIDEALTLVTVGNTG